MVYSNGIYVRRHKGGSAAAASKSALVPRSRRGVLATAAVTAIVDAASVDTTVPAADCDEHAQAVEHVVAAPLL
jgi:hypothetical protein